MKLNPSIALLAVAFLLVNCSKDETPVPKPDTEEQPKPDPKPEEPQEPEVPKSEIYFTLNIDLLYEDTYQSTEPIENWVILHDENGKLLDYSRFAKGNKLTFETQSDTLTEYVTVTKFRYYPQPGNFDYIIDTSQKIPVGADGNRDLKYHYFSNPNGQNDFSVEYPNDFSDFNHYVEIDLPEYSWYSMDVTAHPENEDLLEIQGFNLYDISSDAEIGTKTQLLKIGYLNQFQQYRTSFTLVMDLYSYSLHGFGPKFEEIKIPELPNLAIIDNSLNNFEFSVDIDYIKYSQGRITMSESDYPDFSGTSWIIEAPNGYTPKIGELPIEILNLYPLMDLNNLQYRATTLHIDQNEYRSSLIEPEDPKNYINESIVVNAQ